MIRKKRQPTPVLTTSQVQQIRWLYQASGVTHKQLAECFGVTRTAIGKVIARVTWKLVA